MRVNEDRHALEDEEELLAPMFSFGVQVLMLSCNMYACLSYDP